MVGYRNPKTTLLVRAALFSALYALLTGWINIRIPGGGYIHPGDAILFNAAITMGGSWGAAVGALGGALADWMTGVPEFIPATVLLKAAAALCVCLFGRRNRVARIVSEALAGIAMAAGYFVYQGVLMGWAAALTGVIPNLIQAGVSCVLAEILFEVFEKHKLFRRK